MPKPCARRNAPSRRARRRHRDPEIPRPGTWAADRADLWRSATHAAAWRSPAAGSSNWPPPATPASRTAGATRGPGCGGIQRRAWCHQRYRAGRALRRQTYTGLNIFVAAGNLTDALRVAIRRAAGARFRTSGASGWPRWRSGAAHRNGPRPWLAHAHDRCRRSELGRGAAPGGLADDTALVAVAVAQAGRARACAPRTGQTRSSPSTSRPASRNPPSPSSKRAVKGRSGRAILERLEALATALRPRRAGLSIPRSRSIASSLRRFRGRRHRLASLSDSDLRATFTLDALSGRVAPGETAFFWQMYASWRASSTSTTRRSPATGASCSRKSIPRATSRNWSPSSMRYAPAGGARKPAFRPRDSAGGTWRCRCFTSTGGPATAAPIGRFTLALRGKCWRARRRHLLPFAARCTCSPAATARCAGRFRVGRPFEPGNAPTTAQPSCGY